MSYPQCSPEEKSVISAMISKCSGCLGDSCPPTCCRESTGGNQLIICEVPPKGSAGCCIRVMGLGQVEIASKEVATTIGVDEYGACIPNDPNNLITSSCGNTTCAVAGINGTEINCPNGVQVPTPKLEFQSPAKCLDGTSDGASGGTSNSTTSGGDTGNSSVGDAQSPAPSPNPTQSSESTHDGTTEACFHGSATVQLSDRSSKLMSELAVGDVVKVGRNEFSPVFMFTHRDAMIRSLFLNIATASGHHLMITPGHYLYVDGKLAPAFEIRNGHSLSLGNGSSSTVVSVTRSFARGIYNPQTVHGDIVVNGIQASTYTVSLSPSYAHAFLAPLRFLYVYLGISAGSFENGLPLARLRDAPICKPLS